MSYTVEDSFSLSQHLSLSSPHPVQLLLFVPSFTTKIPSCCCLLCLPSNWSHFGSAPGDIWIPDSQLPENSLPCWIYLLIWDPPLGVLLETCLARVGKLHPMFFARSRRCVAEDNSKCVLGFVRSGPFF